MPPRRGRTPAPEVPRTAIGFPESPGRAYPRRSVRGAPESVAPPGGAGLQELTCVFGLVAMAALVGAVVAWLKAHAAHLHGESLAGRIRALERDVAELRDAMRGAAPGDIPIATRVVPEPPEPAVPAPAAPDVRPPGPAEPPPPLVPPPLPAAVPTPVRATPIPRRVARTDDAVERFLGGRVFLVGGVLAVLVGLGFFLKLAIDRGWIGPAARLAVGAAAGAVALVAGHRLRGRGLDVFGQALMGGGLGALFLCDAFASIRYGFYERPAAFALAAAISALGVVLAVRGKAPFLAWLGFAGAFAAPAILGENRDALEGLSGWLAAADLGIAAVLCFRRWPGLDILAALATAAYLAAWNAQWAAPDRTAAAAVCLGALTVVMIVAALAPPLVARRRVAASWGALAITLAHANALAWDLFHARHGTALAAAGVCTAAFLVGVSGVVLRRGGDAGDASALRAFAWALVLAAVPAQFRDAQLPAAWAILGAGAMVAALRSGGPWLAAGGGLSIALAGLATLARLSFLDADPPVLNGEFLSALAPVAASAIAGAVLLRWPGGRLRDAGDVALAAATTGATLLAVLETFAAIDDVRGGRFGDAVEASTWIASGLAAAAAAVVARREMPGPLAAWGPLTIAVLLTMAGFFADRPEPHVIAWNLRFGSGLAACAACGVAALRGVRPSWLPTLSAAVLLFLVVSAEWLTWGSAREIGEDPESRRFRAQVGLSATWALYAAALIAAGFAARRPAWRWAGIGLFVVTAGKVVTVDLIGLDTAYRVGSFLALGTLLVVASYLYQRARRDDAPRDSG